MFQHMRDAAGAAGKVKIQERTEQCPTQAGAVGDGGVDLADRHDPLADEVEGFAPQRGLQAVGNVSLDLPPRLDGLLPHVCIEREGPPKMSAPCSPATYE